MSTRDHAASSSLAPLVVLAGGGSGGHVFPALAVGDELARRGWRVSACGSLRGMEAELYGRHGVPFHALPAEPVVGQGLGQRVHAVTTLVRGAARAAALLSRLGVRAVVATGGYAAAPAMLGARLIGRPMLLVEPNAAAGLTSRALSFCCQEAAVAHAETGDALACPATLTGVPLRSEFTATPAPLPPFEPELRLLVVGGSQGAVTLNRLLPAAACAAAAELGRPLAIVHQAGARHLEATRAAWDAALATLAGTASPDDDAADSGASDRGASNRRASDGAIASIARSAAAGADATRPAAAPRVRVEVVPFLADMAGAFAASHLVLSRAGAITLAEICAAGRPSLLLPLSLAGGHQRANAQALERAGAAHVLAGGSGGPTAAALTAALVALLGAPAGLVNMAAAARALARPDAAARIADRVEALAGVRPGAARGLAEVAR